MEMRAVYAECLAGLMEQDRHVCVLDADLAKASGTRGLYERFPEQMFDCGVAEQNMASIAAGLASYGFKPWIESFTPFASRRICGFSSIRRTPFSETSAKPLATPSSTQKAT